MGLIGQQWENEWVWLGRNRKMTSHKNFNLRFFQSKPSKCT